MAKSETGRKSVRLPRDLQRAVLAGEDKKAEHLVVLDLRTTGGFTDFFVICSGTNPRHIRAIADGVIDALASDGVKTAHVEGHDRSEWILLDYFDFVVHIFARETRTFYGLERLWGNAEPVLTRLTSAPETPAASSPASPPVVPPVSPPPSDTA